MIILCEEEAYVTGCFQQISGEEKLLRLLPRFSIPCVMALLISAL